MSVPHRFSNRFSYPPPETTKHHLFPYIYLYKHSTKRGPQCLFSSSKSPNSLRSLQWPRRRAARGSPSTTPSPTTSFAQCWQGLNGRWTAMPLVSYASDGSISRALSAVFSVLVLAMPCSFAWLIDSRDSSSSIFHSLLRGRSFPVSLIPIWGRSLLDFEVSGCSISVNVKVWILFLS